MLVWRRLNDMVRRFAISAHELRELAHRKGDELVDLMLGLTATHLDVRIVRRGLEIAWSAACCTTVIPKLTSKSANAKRNRQVELPSFSRVF